MPDLDDLFQQAIEESPNPTFILDHEGKVMLWNRACEVFTGTRAVDVLHTVEHKKVFYPDTFSYRQTLADIIVTGRQAELEQLYPAEQKPRKNGERICAEGWYPNLGGKDRYISFAATPVYNHAGEMVAVVETFHDITERRRDKETLSTSFDKIYEAKRQWEETMDCIDDLVMLVDGAGKIKRCNQSIKSLLELSYHDVLNADWRELLQQGGVVFAPEGGRANECYYPKTDRWFLLKDYEFRSHENSGESGTVITLQDRTEARRMTMALEQAHTKLKETQSQMLQSEKMASVGQLAAGVAHEINNPIGFVKSNLNSLKRYVDRLADFIEKQEQIMSQLPASDASESMAQLRKQAKIEFILEDIRELQEESLDGIARVNTIVQNLKTFSRIDQAELSNTDLNECLESTLNIAWNELKYKVTIEKDLAELPLIRCYPQQLNQLILNLLVNAGQAINESGIICLKTWQKGDYVYLSISDTGCGIPEQNLKRLFEPFFTTKEVGKGTGLGLSICYDIIKKHGGDILVESQVGQGSTFTLKLPLHHLGE